MSRGLATGATTPGIAIRPGFASRLGAVLRRLAGAVPLGAALPLLAVVFCALGQMADALPNRAVRHLAFDQLQRLHPRPYVDAPVRIVDIDDESLRRLGQWPWPRTRLAELTARLQDANAAAIAFDVVFAEPDRTSPRAMTALWRLDAEAGRSLEALPDHDEIFARTLARGRVVLGFAGGEQAKRVDATAATASGPSTAGRFVVQGAAPLAWLPALGGSVTNLDAFERAAAGDGALTFVPDADGVVRRVPLVVRLGDRMLPSLAAEALRVSQGAREIELHAPDDGAGVDRVRIGALEIATTPRAEAWIHYSEPVPQRYIPAWKVLAGEVPPAELAGRILLVGASAQGLMDLRFSPVAGLTPGVEMHAQWLEQVLTGESLERPAWAAGLEWVVGVLGGLAVAGIALGASARLSAAGFVALTGAWCAAAWWAFTCGGVLLDPLSPSIALLLPFGLGHLVRHHRAERRQRWVKAAFSRYVSPNLVEYLVAHPQQLELGGRRRVCSFVFTDLAGFTSLMERMDPAEAVALLNDYLDGMIAIAFEHQGTLDRIVGDAVAIVFSAPVEQADHAQRALACALRMHRFAEDYVQKLDAGGRRFGRTRIGVHTGEVIVGNFGGSHMFDYRALGDPVNTAARLEGANRHLGTWICVSEATLAGCPGAVARPIGRLVLKGRSSALAVHEPLADDASRDEAYDQAHAWMVADDPRAPAAFEALASARPDDPLVALHARRLRAGQRGELIVLEEK